MVLAARHGMTIPQLLVMSMLAGVSVLLSLNDITPVNVLGIVLLSLVLFSERIEAFFDRDR